MFIIREWTVNDFNAVITILKETWIDTYSAFIPMHDILGYLEKTYNLATLNDIYEDKSNTAFIVTIDGKDVAWMRLKNSEPDERFYISSLYVLPGLQGIGLGKALIRAAEEAAGKSGFSRIYLGVMKQNGKSLQWYIKNGFIFEEEQPFMMGSTEVPHLIGYKNIE